MKLFIKNWYEDKRSYRVIQLRGKYRKDHRVCTGTGFYRNRIEPYEGNDKCVGKEKYSFDFAVCYFTNPTTPEYYNNVLYHFEEKVLIDIARLINNDNLPTHQDYEYMSEALSIDDITFKSSTITTILTNGTNYNWGNMVRMIYQVDFSIDVNKL